MIASVNHGIRLAIGEFLAEKMQEIYRQQMLEAAQDKEFMLRTLEAQEAFSQSDADEATPW